MPLDLCINIGLDSGGSQQPYSGYALALDFKNGVYRFGANLYTLSGLPGYSFTDNVDNLPNMGVNGFTALTAEISRLAANVCPITTDTDFIWWGTVNLPVADATYDMIATMSGATASYLGRHTGGNHVFRDGVSEILSGVAAPAGRNVILARRRGGKSTLAYKLPNLTVTVGAEGGATAWVTQANPLLIGQFTGGGNQPDGAIEGVFIRLGTFTDQDLTNQLTAA